MSSVGIGIGFGILVVVAAFLWAGSEQGTSDTPAEFEIHEVTDAGSDKPDGVGPLRLLSWNIGYGRGDLGDYSGPWKREVFEKNLQGITETIRDSGAEIVLLQEVDLGASRSHKIHQGKWLQNELGWGYLACVETWTNRYVPFPYWPVSRQFGAMRSGQCVVSRYPLTKNIRVRLPQPAANPFWYNRFYLHRAFQHVRVEHPTLGVIPLVNVHLEAFDVQNNLQHIELLLAYLAATPEKPWLVGGDFNAVPGDAQQKSGFSDEPEMSFEDSKSMETFFAKSSYRDAVGESDRPEAFTFPTDIPTRRLDYLTYSPTKWVGTGRVLTDPTVRPLSDHLPLVGEFSIREPSR